ncbi:MAG: hypothetical protein KGJ78_17755 [Alphaproteobacteria bacterium]|nr:hypothetical protein [Alphaproteobacteria bacterium]
MQRELGALLGVSADAIYLFEKLKRRPSVEALIGAEFLFGVHARMIFPALYASIEREIARRAADFAEVLGGLDDAASRAKRQLIEELVMRVAGEQPHI